MASAFPLALYYFTLLGALGLYWPYLSLHLAGIGFSATEITRLMSLAPVMGAVTPVALGLLADARRARVWLLRAGSVGSALAFALLPGARGHLAIWLAFALFGLCRSPLTTLADASAVEHVRARGGSYGGIRLWGSAGFLVAVASGGALADALGTRAVMLATTAALAAAAACAFALPAPPVEKRAGVLGAWREMLGARELRLFLGAVLLAQVACSAYDACFTLHLLRLGHGGRFTGAAWGLGVLAEIALLSVSARVIARIGAERLLALALATAAVRWLLLARAVTATEILLLQPLHALTFGAFHAASVTIMRDRGGDRTPTAAQGLYLATASLGTVLGMSVAGRLFDGAGGETLFTAAAIVATAALASAWRFAGAPRRAPVEVVPG